MRKNFPTKEDLKCTQEEYDETVANLIEDGLVEVKKENNKLYYCLTFMGKMVSDSLNYQSNILN